MVLPDDPKYALKKVWQEELDLYLTLFDILISVMGCRVSQFRWKHLRLDSKLPWLCSLLHKEV